MIGFEALRGLFAPTRTRSDGRDLRDELTASNLFDADFYRQTYSAELTPDEDALEHFLQIGLAKGYRPNERFDPLIQAIVARTGDPESALIDYVESRKRYSPVSRGQPALLKVMPRIDPELWNSGGKVRDWEDDRRRCRAYAQTASQPNRIAFSYDGLKYALEVPAARLFFDMIRDCESFTLTKLPHGFWDACAFVELLSEQIGRDARFRNFSSYQRFVLAVRWAHEIFPKRGVLAENFILEMDKVLREVNQDTSVYRGVAFKGFPTWDERIFNLTSDWSEQQWRRLEVFSRYFSPRDTILDGNLVKRWAISGDLSQLPNLLRQRPVLLVTSATFSNLGSRWGLKNFHHIRIPPRNTHAMRHDLLGRCSRQLQGLIGPEEKANAPILLTQCGGSLAYWLIHHLRRAFPRVSYLDLGQALSIWFLDRNDIAITPWLRLYGRQLIENCELHSYYAALGYPDIAARPELNSD